MRISDWSSDVCSSDLLADALSGWPVRHPLGDPRNPPVTSLLTPLLGHWGMVLGAAPPGERAAPGFDVAGRRLRLFSAGRFDPLPAACRSAERRLGIACVCTCRSRWSPYHLNNTHMQTALVSSLYYKQSIYITLYS